MKNIDLLPIPKETKDRINILAMQYKRFAKIHIEIVSCSDERVIVRVEQKEPVNDIFLSKPELEARVRELFNGELPDGLKLTISAVNFDRKDIADVTVEWILGKMDKLGLKAKHIENYTGIDKSTLSILFSERRELTKFQKVAFYYFFKYYESWGK